MLTVHTGGAHPAVWSLSPRRRRRPGPPKLTSFSTRQPQREPGTIRETHLQAEWQCCHFSKGAELEAELMKETDFSPIQKTRSYLVNGSGWQAAVSSGGTHCPLVFRGKAGVSAVVSAVPSPMGARGVVNEPEQGAGVWGACVRPGFMATNGNPPFSTRHCGQDTGQWSVF